MPEFDAAFYKRLAANDTPGGGSHQGGVVIPTPLRDFFPPLDASAASPTIDVALSAELFLGDEPFGEIQTRYQYQTWGGRRSPESRVTGNLAPLLRTAQPHDILVMEREIGSARRYRFTLVRNPPADFQGGARWGTVGSQSPRSLVDVAAAANILSEDIAGPFVDEDARGIVTVNRLRRLDAFRFAVRNAYHAACALCGIGFTDGAAFEVEAAHIVPVGRGGADRLSNGISLCGTHHWCFDRGLFWIDQTLRMRLSDIMLAHAQNASLAALDGTTIRRPSSGAAQPSPLAFFWHAREVARVDA